MLRQTDDRTHEIRYFGRIFGGFGDFMKVTRLPGHSVQFYFHRICYTGLVLRTVFARIACQSDVMEVDECEE